jgi:hypothetical protein
MAISPTSVGDAKSDETGLARTNREIRARTDTPAGTNPRREVPLPREFARPRHALRAALRDSLGLIGPQQPLPAPLAAVTAHGLEELRRVGREMRSESFDVIPAA